MCILQSQSHSKVLYNQTMVVSTIFSELLTLLQSNLIDDTFSYARVSREIIIIRRKKITVFKVKVIVKLQTAENFFLPDIGMVLHHCEAD